MGESWEGKGRREGRREVVGDDNKPKIASHLNDECWDEK